MESRNAIKAKRIKGMEERKHCYELISEVNHDCAIAPKNGLLPAETSGVMEKLENWLLASSFGIFTSFQVVTYFFLNGDFIEIEEKKKQHIVIWSVNVSPPGCKKTPR